ncbi:hypothetical protein [Clostridium sp.]|jgi:hypothetical protein
MQKQIKLITKLMQKGLSIKDSIQLSEALKECKSCTTCREITQELEGKGFKTKTLNVLYNINNGPEKIKIKIFKNTNYIMSLNIN